MDEQQAIEQDFSISWDHMEAFFTLMLGYAGWEWLIPIHGFIAQLRERGYDKQLRAGQSMATFVLSRSRRHGLRNEQARLGIALRSQGGMHLRYYAPNEDNSFTTDRVELTKELEELITRLLVQPID